MISAAATVCGAGLSEGLVDFCVPMLYIFFVLDSQMPIHWLVDAAHEADASVYGVLQPYYAPEGGPQTLWLRCSAVLATHGLELARHRASSS